MEFLLASGMDPEMLAASGIDQNNVMEFLASMGMGRIGGIMPRRPHRDKEETRAMAEELAMEAGLDRNEEKSSSYPYENAFVQFSEQVCYVVGDCGFDDRPNKVEMEIIKHCRSHSSSRLPITQEVLRAIDDLNRRNAARARKNTRFIEKQKQVKRCMCSERGATKRGWRCPPPT